jgi:hypothetical protein
MYRWDGDSGEWALHGGTLDTSANTVTASITSFGTYTLGPVMPTGRITWTVQNVGPTSATLVSDPILNNNGSVVPAGTLVHVDVAEAVQIVTPDASAAHPGVQIATDATGRLTVQVSLAGSVPGLSVFAFSDIGTARCDTAVPVP